MTMKLRDFLTIAALGMLIGSAYAFMQKSDAKSSERDQATLYGKLDK